MKGKRAYDKFLKGNRLSPLQSIIAQCYICNGADEGGVDCNGKSCPLYTYMPYRKNRIVKPKKILTNEQKKNLTDRFLKAREAKKRVKV